MSDRVISYRAEPTAKLFHRSPAFIRGICGPIGSGKSVAAAIEVFRCACEQEPDARGLRRTRWGVIRNTYGELKSTTIKTWLDWFGDLTRMVYDAPIYGYLRMALEDGTVVECELVFVSVDRPQQVGKLKSLELSGLWLNEATELPKDVFDMGMGRVGRFPPKKDGVRLTHPAVIMDTNAAEEEHWYHQLESTPDPELMEMIEKARIEAGYTGPVMEFFTQPPALIERRSAAGMIEYVPNPDAENVQNQQLGYLYWLQQVPKKSRSWIRRFIMARKVAASDGRIVFPEFNEDFHVAKKPLKPVPNLPLRLGFDFALTPACIISQWTPRGRLVLLDEVCAEPGSMGITRFLQTAVVPFLRQKYRGFEVELAVGDPSGTKRDETNESSSLKELIKVFPGAMAARTNALVPRREAVATLMSRVVEGLPGFIVSPTCRVLIQGFTGKYVYQRVQVIGPEPRYKDEPIKTHPWSDIQDAVQYVAMECTGEIDDAAATNARRQRERELAAIELQDPSYGYGTDSGDAGY